MSTQVSPQMEMATQIVTAYLANNQMQPDQIIKLLEDVFHKIIKLESLAVGIPEINRNSEKFKAEFTEGGSVEFEPVASKFDPEKWLASLPEANPFVEAEARANNPNLEKGWVGVYDKYIVCLINGQRTRVLNGILKRSLKEDPRAISPEVYRAHFRLPADYPMSAPEFHRSKSEVIRNVHRLRKQELNDGNSNAEE